MIGRWSPDEHAIFLKGIDMFGKDWTKIATLLTTRSIIQVRTHAQKYFLRVQKTSLSESFDENGCNILERKQRRVRTRSVAHKEEESSKQASAMLRDLTSELNRDGRRGRRRDGRHQVRVNMPNGMLMGSPHTVSNQGPFDSPPQQGYSSFGHNSRSDSRSGQRDEFGRERSESWDSDDSLLSNPYTSPSLSPTSSMSSEFVSDETQEFTFGMEMLSNLPPPYNHDQQRGNTRARARGKGKGEQTVKSVIVGGMSQYEYEQYQQQYQQQYQEQEQYSYSHSIFDIEDMDFPPHLSSYFSYSSYHASNSNNRSTKHTLLDVPSSSSFSSLPSATDYNQDQEQQEEENQTLLQTWLSELENSKESISDTSSSPRSPGVISDPFSPSPAQEGTFTHHPLHQEQMSVGVNVEDVEADAAMSIMADSALNLTDAPDGWKDKKRQRTAYFSHLS